MLPLGGALVGAVRGRIKECRTHTLLLIPSAIGVGARAAIAPPPLPARSSVGPSVAKGAFRAPPRGLSMERVRSILGPDCRLGQVDLERLRDHLAVLASIILDEWEGSGGGPTTKSDAAESRKTG